LGSTRIERADVRLVAATNADLAGLSECGRFRQDLLFRIDLLSINLPPLRQREGDALLLAQAFVQRLSRQYRTPLRRLDPASIDHLRLPLPWPGNVRELEHRVHRAFLLDQGESLDLQLSGIAAAAGHRSGSDCNQSIDTFAAAKARAIRDFERHYLLQILSRAGGNLSLAARLAGKERSRFSKLVRKHGLQHGNALPQSVRS
jgi:transcriptional regulator with GAF, ATPase, and Fis domain